VSEKCQHRKEAQVETNFYVVNHPFFKRYPVCKDCINDNVDTDDVESVKRMLLLLDFPFFIDEWENVKYNYSKNGWFGRYLYVIGRSKYKNLSWKDSIIEPPITKEQKEKRIFVPPKMADISTDTIEFFGIGYTPEEYVEMQKKYDKLKNSNGTTNMHIEALKKYVLYRVKEEFAISKNQRAEAKQWGDLANKAADAAKIKPSQFKKEDLMEGINTISEIREIVEREDDILHVLPEFKCAPNDALDFIIWCFINYCRKLEGMPECSYEDVYRFYDEKVAEYIESRQDPFGIYKKDIFKNDQTKKNRGSIKNFIKKAKVVEAFGDKNEENI